MTWEWVAPAGATAVGVTSVVATFAASRAAQAREERSAARQRRYAVEDARRQERKSAYLAYLDAVTAVENSTEPLADTEFTDVAKRAAEGAVVKALAVLGVRLFEIRVVGTDVVFDAAREVFDSARDGARRAITDPPVYQVVDATVLGRLVEVVAQDLRLEVPG